MSYQVTAESKKKRSVWSGTLKGLTPQDARSIVETLKHAHKAGATVRNPRVRKYQTMQWTQNTGWVKSPVHD